MRYLRSCADAKTQAGPAVFVAQAGPAVFVAQAGPAVLVAQAGPATGPGAAAGTKRMGNGTAAL
jgi:hypothetical protein